MVSDAQFAAWLKDPGPNYTVLCRMLYAYQLGEARSDAVLRFATLTYTDLANDQHYPDWIDRLPSYSRDLVGENLNNFASTIGAIVLNNADGRCDFIADLYVDGSEATFLVGDTSWPITDFRVIFVATVSKVLIPSKDQLVIELRDSGLLLNKTIGGEFKVGGEGPNADQFRPVNIGYVAQAEAILQDLDTQTFVYNDTGDGLWLGGTEQVVRDNGYPVGFIDNGDGTLTLDDSSVGTVTTNVMATPAGDEGNRLTSDVMDALVRDRAGLGDLGKYDGAQDTFEVGGDEDYPLGLNITDRRGLIDVLREVCDSGLCFWAISRLNSFFYGRLRPSYITILDIGSAATITADHIEAFSREPFDPKYHRFQIYMNRNWSVPGTTVSTDSGGDPRILTPDEIATVTRKGLAVAQEDSVGSEYSEVPEQYHQTLSVSPEIETLLSDPDDEESRLVGAAWMEVARANQLPWLHVVTVRVPLQFYELELGNVVTLELDRFDYDLGAEFQVIGVGIELLTRKCSLRLLRRHLQEPYEGRETAPADDPESDIELGDATPGVTESTLPPFSYWDLNMTYQVYDELSELSSIRSYVSYSVNYMLDTPNAGSPIPFPNKKQWSWYITHDPNQTPEMYPHYLGIWFGLQALGITAPASLYHAPVNGTTALSNGEIVGITDENVDTTSLGIWLVPRLHGAVFGSQMWFGQDSFAHADVFGGYSVQRIGSGVPDGDDSEAHVSTFSETWAGSDYQPWINLHGLLWSDGDLITANVTQTGGDPVTLPVLTLLGRAANGQIWMFDRSASPSESYAGTSFSIQAQIDGVDFGNPITLTCEV